MVTIGSGHVDVFTVSDGSEAMSVLKSIRQNTDATADEVVRSVSFSGLSMRDTVVTYSAFMKQEEGAQLISFEKRGMKKVPVQLALEFEREVA